MWLQLTAIDRVTEFDKHYCDRDLRDFLRGDPDMFAEMGAPSPNPRPQSQLQQSTGNGEAGGDAAWDEEGFTEAGANNSTVSSGPSGAQPRQRRPGRTNYIK